MSYTRVKMCDSCDDSIAHGESTVSYPLALGVSIDLHKRCADRDPQGGFTTELARKARSRS